MLAEIERPQGCSVASSFDLLAETSVVGIVALGLAADTPASEIQAAFERTKWVSFVFIRERI